MKDKQRSTSQVEDKHTPGPWHHDEYGHICAGPQIIGDAYQFDYDELPCIPNARLMAAAPELLNLLSECLEQLEVLHHLYEGEFSERIEAADKAAVKAWKLIAKLTAE